MVTRVTLRSFAGYRWRRTISIRIERSDEYHT